MQNDRITEDQIRAQFVTSLMDYYKIEENPTLRSHIDDLVRALHPSQYREFFRRLSTRDMPYKNSFEKIASISAEFESESVNSIDHEAQERTSNLYTLMYDLHREITLIRNPDSSGLERFENIRFDSIKRQNETQPLLDTTDINVVKRLSKRWIYDYVSLDRSLFDMRVLQEYRNEILRREREKNDFLAAPLKAKFISSLARS